MLQWGLLYPYAMQGIKHKSLLGAGFVFLLLFSCELLAHHPSGSSSTSTTTTASTRSLFFQSSRTKPVSRISFVYDFTYVDDAIGNMHTASLNGELALHPRFSLLANLPLSFLDHDFRSNALGFGDISVGGKYLIVDQYRGFLFAALQFLLPTGDANSGLGRSSIGQQIELTGGYRFGDWTVFTGAATAFSYFSEQSPQVTIFAGTNTPAFLNDRVYFTLSLIAPVFFSDSVLKEGSWKLFAEPQLNWSVTQNKKLTLSLACRLSLVDQLSRKTGVTITQTSNALLNDTRIGVTTGMHYSF